MILRVWALYNQSVFVLGTLLTLYAIEIIPKLIGCVWASTRSAPTAITVQILDFSFCVSQDNPPIWFKIIGIAQITFGTAMCLLIVIQLIREALQMYKERARFHLNHYVKLLVREGIVYFLAILLLSLLHTLYDATSIPQGRWWTSLFMLQYIPPFTLVPRFILNLRALYAWDLQGDRGKNIDSAFGLTSGSSRSTVRSTIVFVDAGYDSEGEKEGEEIQMIERASWQDRCTGTQSA